MASQRFILAIGASTAIWLASLPALAQPTADLQQDSAAQLNDAGTVLSDPAEPLERARPRGEETQYRLLAGAHYATGRTLFQQGNLAGALRQYQRAWRWDPSAQDILGDIVALAFSLERGQEAVRYALLAAERSDSDALTLRRLALYVTEEGDLSRAVRLYRLWLDHPDTRLDQSQLDQLLIQLEVGRLEFLSGDPQAASATLGKFQHSFLDAGADSKTGQRVRQALGDDLNTTWELTAMAHLEAEAYGLATEALDQIELPLDEAGRNGYLKAKVALKEGEPLVAWEQLRSYLKAGYVEDGTEPYELLAEILTRLNQPETIVLELARLQQEAPHNPALAVALAREFERLEREPAAIETYRSVALSDEEFPELLVSEAADRLIRLYAQRDEADELWGLLLAVADKLAEVGQLEEALGSIAESPGLVDRLIPLAQQDESIGKSAARSTIVATLLLEAERFEEAQLYFAQALELSEDKAELALAWGLSFLTAEQNHLAADTFRQAIDQELLTAGESVFHYYLAMSLELAGDTDAALDVARQAAEMQPDDAGFAAQVAWVLYHADRRTEAIQQYQQVLEKFDDQRDAETRRELRDVRSSLSTLAVMEGDIQAGEEWLQQVLDEFPENVGAKNDLGYLWADTNRHLSRAREMIQTAVDAEPENSAYRDSLGWVLYRQGRFDDAVHELEKATELSRAESGSGSDADAIILDHLGDAYLKQGQTAAAIEAWRNAAEGLQESDPQQAEDVREKIDQHATKTE